MSIPQVFFETNTRINALIISFVEQCQYCLVNIIVDKDNTFLCTLNQVGHESIGIIYLTIVEHTAENG